MMTENDCEVKGIVFRTKSKVLRIYQRKLRPGFNDTYDDVYLDFQNDEEIDNLIDALTRLKGAEE